MAGIARAWRNATSFRIVADGAVRQSNIRAIRLRQLAFVNQRVEHALEQADVLTDQRVEAIGRVHPARIVVSTRLAVQ